MICSMREPHLVEVENKGTQLVPAGMQTVCTNGPCSSPSVLTEETNYEKNV
jgi:hypothetical protein